MTSDVMGNGKKKTDPALTDLYANLQKAANLPSTEEELAFLNELLQSKELNALVNIHNRILGNVERRRCFPIPALSDGMHVLADVLELLLQQPQRTEECQELFLMLQKPLLQGLLCAHDAVAQKDYYPHLPDIPVEEDDGEQTIKIVQLVKSNEPLVIEHSFRASSKLYRVPPKEALPRLQWSALNSGLPVQTFICYSLY